jgi:nicotinate phosphoribosyltransferase
MPEPAAGSALLTDLYQLTMGQAYFAEGIHRRPAVFSLFVRELPPARHFLLACGLDPALSYLESLRFDEDSLGYLRGLGRFTPAFLDHLAGLRFEGDVWALPEGMVCFAEEPLLEIHAPLLQGQLVETALLNRIHQQTLLASAAARVVIAAGGRPVVDFALGRTLGPDGGLGASRAFHLAGVAATSHLLAGMRLGLPVDGTMGHSFVQAHESELKAFRAFVRIYPETVLLVDTYEPLEGVRAVIALAKELGPAFRVRGIRLDSGDLGALADAARRLLDAAGLRDVRIFASGGLDAERIDALIRAGHPIDGFGVGTRMGVSHDAPSLDLAYKLVSVDGRARIKLSPGKRSLPGPKQVFRESARGLLLRDTLALREESLPGQPLLEPVMRAGVRTPAGRRTLEAARQHAAHQLAALPPPLRALERASPPFPVEHSAALRAELARLQADASRPPSGSVFRR